MVLPLRDDRLLRCSRVSLAPPRIILSGAGIELLHGLEPESRRNSLSAVGKREEERDGGGAVPLLLLDGLLPEGHVLHVLLEPVERGVGFHPDTVVVVLGVPSARREANDQAAKNWKRVCGRVKRKGGDLVPRRRVRSPMKMERMSFPKDAALTGSSFCSWQWRR